MKKFLLGMITFSVLPLIALSEVQVPPAKQQEKQEKKIDDALVWKSGSVMYSQEQIEWVEKAMESYTKGIPISTLLPDIFPPDGGEGIEIEKPNEDVTQSGGAGQLPLVAPVFHLDSVLYISPDNWSIWLGGKKVSFGKPAQVDVGKLEIAKVTENSVTMIWSENRIERIFPKWRSYFNPLGDSRFSSNNKNIVADLQTGDISFVLGVNQTLDTASMKILEGEIKEIEPLSKAKDVAKEAASQDANLENAEPDAESDEVVEPIPFKNNSGDSVKDDLESGEDYTAQLKALKKILINNR